MIIVGTIGPSALIAKAGVDLSPIKNKKEAFLDVYKRQTYDSGMFLLRMYLLTLDPKYKYPVERCLDFVLESQMRQQVSDSRII